MASNFPPPPPNREGFLGNVSSISLSFRFTSSLMRCFRRRSSGCLTRSTAEDGGEVPGRVFASRSLSLRGFVAVVSAPERERERLCSISRSLVDGEKTFTPSLFFSPLPPLLSGLCASAVLLCRHAAPNMEPDDPPAGERSLPLSCGWHWQQRESESERPNCVLRLA